MKLILTAALVAITSTSFGAFSMEDYLKAKAAQGEPVLTSPKVEPIVTDYKLGISTNKVRITSNESNLKQLISSRISAQSALSKAQKSLDSALTHLGRVKARASAYKDKNRISTGNPKIRAAAKIVEQKKYELKKAKKGLAGMDLKIKNCQRTISKARQKIVLYTNRLAKEKAEMGACA